MEISIAQVSQMTLTRPVDRDLPETGPDFFIDSHAMLPSFSSAWRSPARIFAAAALASLALLGAALAQHLAGGDNPDLANKLSNPIASLVSVPIQVNHDSGTLGLGPTGIFLFQSGPGTAGGLARPQWGVPKSRDNVPEFNNNFFQPLLAYYKTPSAWRFSANIESGYNWMSDDLSLPLDRMAAKLAGIREQKVQFLLGGRYWLDRSANGPEDLGARARAAFLFPM
ncbi:MAG: hypothetical protein O7I42_11955 [Alphaproteobacteria bacterium]|nr:hypothetical protein [Alphaproteobacteria bacterium]